MTLNCVRRHGEGFESGTYFESLSEVENQDQGQLAKEAGPNHDRSSLRGQAVESEIHIRADAESPPSQDELKARNRHIPMPVRRAVFSRAEGRCEYVDEVTDRLSHVDSITAFEQ